MPKSIALPTRATLDDWCHNCLCFEIVSSKIELKLDVFVDDPGSPLRSFIVDSSRRMREIPINSSSTDFYGTVQHSLFGDWTRTFLI